jgi:hypothetical protein
VPLMPLIAYTYLPTRYMQNESMSLNTKPKSL